MANPSAHKDVVLAKFDDGNRLIGFEVPAGPTPDIGVRYCFARSGTAIALTGTTAETAFVTITIPANSLPINSRLIVTCLWSHTNSANTKTKKVKFGTFDLAAAHQETTTATSRDFFDMIMRTAATQIGYNGTGFGGVAGTLLTGTVDGTVDQNLVITGTLQSGAETLTLEAYSVEVIN